MTQNEPYTRNTTATDNDNDNNNDKGEGETDEIGTDDAREGAQGVYGQRNRLHCQ